MEGSEELEEMSWKITSETAEQPVLPKPNGESQE